MKEYSKHTIVIVLKKLMIANLDNYDRLMGKPDNVYVYVTTYR